MTSSRSFGLARIARRRAIASQSSPYSLASFSVLEAREAREAHLEDGLGLPLGERVRVLLLRLVDLGLRPPRAGDERLEPRERQRHEGDARLVAGRRDSRMVLIDEVDVGDATPRPSMISRCASACRSSKRVRRVTTSRRCAMKASSVSFRLRTAGRPLRDGEVDDAERRLQIGHADRAG